LRAGTIGLRIEPMRAPSRAALVLCALTACYDFHYEEPRDGGTPTGDDAASTAPDAGGDARSNDCIRGGYYCGGERVVGATDTLYRCNADGTSTLMTKCANGCAINPAGKDDACRPPTPCVAGSAYCGGDKVNGDPDVLYRCGADAKSVSVIRRCPKGCRINAGDDDDCIP
jgi:hypothetical protein